MRSVLAVGWYLYMLGGTVAFFARHSVLPAGGFQLVILLGLGFYVAKLYYVNGCTLRELNWYTLLFYMLYYLYYVLLLSLMWVGLYYLTKALLPEVYYNRAFPQTETFVSFARQWVFAGALMGLLDGVMNGLHYQFIILVFTNKVAILEVLRILIALVWVLVFPGYGLVFITFIGFSTMPPHLQRWLSRVLSWRFGRPIDLLNQPIQNNPSADFEPDNELIVYIKGVLIVSIFLVIGQQLAPLSIMMLLVFIVVENVFPLLGF